MALRLLEIVVPEARREEAVSIVADERLLGRWRDDESNDNVLIKVITTSGRAEDIMDRLHARFEHESAFHMTLLPAEAVVPRLELDDRAITPRLRTSSRQRIGREELLAKMSEGTRASQTFMLMTVLSSIVAAVGLLRDDTAVLVGAMVIAPLLTPNMALALAATLGDLALARDALLANLVGVSIALAFACGVGFALDLDPTIPAIVSRTIVGLDDVALALAAGCAGTLAFTTGLSGTLIGVMVAVALLPPLVTFGLLLVSGETTMALGALRLLITNVTCVNLAGVATFLFQGVRPQTWWHAERARPYTRTAVALWTLVLAALVATFFWQGGPPG